MDDAMDSQMQCADQDYNEPSSANNRTLSEGQSFTGNDHLLPIANVGRIMKQALPPNAKISKGAKETMQECASEFIGFITGEASDRCIKDNRKTINGVDICSAMETLGLDEYASAMKKYLQKYREHEEDTSSSRHKSIQIDVMDELSLFRSRSSSIQEVPARRPRGSSKSSRNVP